MKRLSFVKVERELCIGCCLCAEDCPFEAIVIEDDVARILDTCTGCMTCIQVCPNEALSESEESPRMRMQINNQISREQLLSATFGDPFLKPNTKSES